MIIRILFALLLGVSVSMIANAKDTGSCYTKSELTAKIKKGFQIKPWEKAVPDRKEVVTYFGGVGLNVIPDIEGAHPRWLDVAHATPGFAGYDAGIRERDRIVKVDGKPISDFSDDAAVIGAIRGKIGSIVTLTIHRMEGRKDGETIGEQIERLNDGAQDGGIVFEARVKRQSTPDIHAVPCLRIEKPNGTGA